MNSHQAIAMLNNQGVHFFMQGKLDDAKLAIRDAINLARSCLDSMESREGCEKLRSSSSSSSSSSSLLMQRRKKEGPGDHPSSQGQHGNEEESNHPSKEQNIEYVRKVRISYSPDGDYLLVFHHDVASTQSSALFNNDRLPAPTSQQQEEKYMLQPVCLRGQGEDSCTDPFFYAKAIVISKDCTDGRVSLDELAVVVLFNLSLVFHLSSLQGARQQIHGDKAMCCYEMVLDLLRSQDEGHSGQSAFFAAATLNNMGTVLYSKGRFQASRQCFEHLSELLYLCGANPACFQPFLGVREIQQMHLNIVTLREPTFAPGA